MPDYDSYDDNYDYCSDIDEAHALTGECKHDEFFDERKELQEIEKFKDTKLRFCCNDHAYVFKDQCRVIIYILSGRKVLSLFKCNLLESCR